MITDSNSNNERRKSAQRRHVDLGPPAGIGERRINIERRLFNLSIDRGGEWFAGAQHESARKGTTSGH